MDGRDVLHTHTERLIGRKESKVFEAVSYTGLEARRYNSSEN